METAVPLSTHQLGAEKGLKCAQHQLLALVDLAPLAKRKREPLCYS